MPQLEGHLHHPSLIHLSRRSRRIATHLVVTVPASARQLAGWSWQSLLPRGNDLNDFQVLDENTVIAAGNVVTIIRSDDGPLQLFQLLESTNP